MAFLTLTEKTKFDPISLQNIKFVEIPPPTYKYSNIILIRIAWMILMPLFLLILVCASSHELFKDNESRVRTYMIVMGMDRYLYYLSYFVLFALMLLILFIPAGLATIIFLPVSFYIF